MRTLNEPTFFEKAVDASGGAQVDYTNTIDLSHSAGYSVHFTAVRSAAVLAGSVVTQKSNDGSRWIDVSSVVVADSATQDGAIEAVDAFYRYLRIKITTATGKATYTVSVTTKGF